MVCLHFLWLFELITFIKSKSSKKENITNEEHEDPTTAEKSAEKAIHKTRKPKSTEEPDGNKNITNETVEESAHKQVAIK